MHFTWDCYGSFYRISQRLCLTRIPHFPKHLCSWFESFFQPQGWPKDTTETTRMEQTTATIGNCISFISIHFGCLRPSKTICNLETALWHSVWNSPCCDWTSVMPNSPRHEAVAGSCPARCDISAQKSAATKKTAAPPPSLQAMSSARGAWTNHSAAVRPQRFVLKIQTISKWNEQKKTMKQL